MRRDRRELSFLGTLLLGWGLVFAPLVHQLLTHADGHGHSHGVPAEGEHGKGSLEHGTALGQQAPAAPVLLLTVVALAAPAAEAFEAPTLVAWPKVEQPQGP